MSRKEIRPNNSKGARKDEVILSSSKISWLRKIGGSKKANPFVTRELLEVYREAIRFSIDTYVSRRPRAIGVDLWSELVCPKTLPEMLIGKTP